MEEIKAGSIVELKSGGPQLTVLAPVDNNKATGFKTSQYFSVAWFDPENRLMLRDELPVEALELA